MSKKAQGLSINVIIVAAIALIVLVVLVAIFTGRLGIFGKEVSEIGLECTDYKEGDNTASWQSDACGEGFKEIFTAKDSDEHAGQYCCVATG